MLAQPLQRLQELVRLAAGRGEELDDLALRQADAPAHRARQRRRQQQRHHLAGCIGIELGVDGLGDGIALVGDVAGDSRQQLGGDALDFVAHLVIVQGQVLGADEVDVVVLAQRHALEQPCRELHQAAGLPEALVLLEQGDEVLEGRMEGVRLPHLFGDLLDAGCDDVAGVLGLLDLLGVLFRHVGDDALIGHLVDEAGLQDLVDLVAGQLDRRDRHRLAARFLLQVRDRVGQRLGLRLVAAGEVGDDDAAVG